MGIVRRFYMGHRLSIPWWWLLFGLFMGFLVQPDHVTSITDRYFPVVGEMTITSIRDVEGGVEISATAPKYRDCDWRNTLGYLGTRDRDNVPIVVRHLDAPRLRSAGNVLHWERIFIAMPRERLHLIFIDAYHSCRDNIQDLTRSPFFTGSQWDGRIGQ